MNIYKMEKEAKANMFDSLDNLILYIMIIITSPIEDFDEAIKIINDNITKFNDVKLAIIGSFLSSTWQNYKENDCLIYLDQFFPKSNPENKSIICYLKAYDIYMKNEVKKRKKEYLTYLKDSVSYCDLFVNNLFCLAKVSSKETKKGLLIKAKSNIEKVLAKDELGTMSIQEYVKYDFFLEEKILGTRVTYLFYEDLVRAMK